MSNCSLFSIKIVMQLQIISEPIIITIIIMLTVSPVFILNIISAFAWLSVSSMSL